MFKQASLHRMVKYIGRRGILVQAHFISVHNHFSFSTQQHNHNNVNDVNNVKNKMSSFAKALNNIVGGQTAENTNGLNVAAGPESPMKKGKKRERADTSLEEYNQKQSKPQLLNSRQIMIVRGFVAYSFNPATKQWRRLSDNRRDRSYFESVLFDNFVYLISTFNVGAAGSVERYNLATDRWETVASLPRPVRSVAAAVVPTSTGESKIFVTGGRDLSTMEGVSDVWVFDPQGKSKKADAVGCWQKYANSLLVPRLRHAAVVFQDKLWVLGGIVQDGDKPVYTETTECMDIATGVWSKGPSMHEKRAIEVAPIVINGELYVVGGDMIGPVHLANPCDKESAAIESIEKLCPESNSWKHVTTFKSQRRGFCAAALSGDSKIFIFGGKKRDEDLKTWDSYDVITGRWASDEPGHVGNDIMPMDSLHGHAVALS